MNTGTITINKKKHAFSFKQKARRLFMRKHGLEYFNEYQMKVQSMIPDKKKGMGLTQMNVLADLLITAIEAESVNQVDLKTEEVADFLFDNPEEMERVMSDMAAASEQEEKTKKSSGGSGGKSKKSG